MKKADDYVKEFLKTHDVTDRLKPRDAFFGGRTNAIKLYHEGAAKYIDFTSLYPWCNKYCRYPLGHPTIITENFEDIQNYLGFVKCKILPPRGLYHPVLPFRQHGKLLFPLCHTCCESRQETLCEHSEEERELVGTWVTEEVKKAVEKGYKIKKWKQKELMLDQDTNIFLAAFTTRYARLKLYNKIEKFDRQVLYFDTDSIIYSSNGINDLSLGNFLGEFTDELDGETICIFVSGGPKNYAYLTETGKNLILLNFINAQKLNFDSIKHLVTSMDLVEKIPLQDPHKTVRDPKKRKVLRREETKFYKFVYDKRIVQPDFTTLPYGY
ncbi:hypothetical protein AVEN_224458-1 [Araneus ventricosus]|uniref:DNA-directed DNA polymerase n=1 Tax=Araneus ventricosus TaxID=182803 RepID=A0A4Y2RG06_ARAVE|nr:hypothetical protein AVEN_224458-1 [Araneus ventricosus]